MDAYVSCIGTDLENGNIMVEDVSLPQGTLRRVYLTSDGISAICAHTETPQCLYESLRNLLGTASLTLYVGDTGRYEPFERLVTILPEGSEQREREIREQLTATASVYSTDRIMRMYGQLLRADAYHRGYYRDSDGVLFIRRHDRFERASEHDPELLFNLTLFGGFLGLHRFAMGKIFSGLFYLFTCGVFLIGWLMDILQLLLGIQRDRQKALILPLSNRRRKLLRLIPALVTGAVALVLYLRLVSGLTGPSTEFLSQNAFTELLADTLLQLFPELSESP